MRKKNHKSHLHFLLYAGILLLASFVCTDVHAVTPSYTASSSYKSGKYYTQLQSVELTGDQATDIVNIALSQNGYHEGGNRSDLSGSGSQDTDSTKYTEYSQTLHNASANANWCAYFVSWCARQARIPASIIPKTGGCGTMRNDAGTYYDVTSGYTPKAGDLFLLEPTKEENGKYVHYVASRNSKGIPSLSSHVGIVTKVSGGRMYFIEGNSNQKVHSSSILLQTVRGNKYWIQGYMHPNYNNGITMSADSCTEGSEEEDGVSITSSINVTATKAEDITTNNATVYGHCSKPSSSVKIDTCGLYFGTSSSNLKRLNTETVTSGANNKDNGTGFDIWYNLGSELGQTLKPNTTYYYQFYCTYGEHTYKSAIASFKTKKTTQIYNYKSKIGIIKEVKQILCYNGADSTTTNGHFDNLTVNGTINCTKYADLSDGSRRFCCTSNSVDYWFTYDSSCMGVPFFLATSITPSISRELVLNTSEGTNSCSFLITQSPSFANESIVHCTDTTVYTDYDPSIVYVGYHGNTVNGREFSITGNKPGTTTVTFKTYYGGITTSIKVTVVDCEPPEFENPAVSASGNGYTVSADVTDYAFEAFGVRTWLACEDKESVPIDWSASNLTVTDGYKGLYKVTKNVSATVNFADYGHAAGLYYTELYAKDSSGNIGCIASSHFANPEEISVLVSAITSSDSAITVSWDAVSNADQYAVYRKTSDTDWIQIGTTDTLTYTDTTAAAGTAYTYSVQACYSEDGSYTGSPLSSSPLTQQPVQTTAPSESTEAPDADTSSGSTENSNPDTPYNNPAKDSSLGAPPAASPSVARAKLLSAKRKNAKKAVIKIKKQNGIDGYQILLARNKKFTSGRRTVNVTKNKKTIGKLKKGKIYYVKVRAYKLNAQGQKIYGAYSTVKKIKKR